MSWCHWTRHIYGFRLTINSSIGPNQAPLQDIRLPNPIDLEFDHSRTLKVKSNGAVGLPIYGFLLMSNSNHMCISHRLGDIRT